ncbi:MAG: NAD(P)/FAD-dependent oxidoreductase [Deltaproteobacteria bacterium]|nr:NAD(P)/FAD-dependent oxidoreductase [Deltaproteobacteria bacterium]
MAKKYDLVIVGGGPAGLMAAKVAGENGLKTALLERKTDATKIRRVDGGNLNPVNEYIFEQTVTFNSEAPVVSPFPMTARTGMCLGSIFFHQGESGSCSVIGKSRNSILREIVSESPWIRKCCYRDSLKMRRQTV